jgi:internalin A
MYGFVVLFPYATALTEPSVFLTWSFSDQRLAWDAAASGLGQSYMEIRENIQKVFSRFLPRVDMLTATPIATIKNNFSRSGEHVKHIGLVYACAASDIRNYHDENPDLRGLFVPLKDVRRLFLANSWNREVIPYACERIAKLCEGARTVEQEIFEQRSFRSRYALHRKVVKPILNSDILSAIFRRTPRKKLKRMMFDEVPVDCERLLDVSAGDHQASIEFHTKAKVVVLNDIAWDTLSVLVSKAAKDVGTSSDFVFVNEDILRAPFLPRAFDVVFCRNTLHHFSTVDEIQLLLARLTSWSKRRVIIAEVLNPNEQMSILDFCRDRYYRNFLGDVGNALLPRSQFEALMGGAFHSSEWKHRITLHRTLGGVIALCVASREQPKEQSGMQKQGRYSEVIPDVYVSYAWGEDSTAEGRNREEIVNRLCSIVRASGMEIGRDKERMTAGDSIEHFAHEISRASCIVAVVSEKYLHSQYCMAQELFRAYRRCDYQRHEFQKKVIALVMDDAKVMLKDELALVRLAHEWKSRLEELKSQLQVVDPHHKSADLWIFVNLLEEMCPRLPDMLAALKDIVMKRGFDEIVADEFQEVLKRLPSSQKSRMPNSFDR